MLSDSFAGKDYLGPYKVMNDLRKILGDGPAAVAQAPGASATPVAVATSASTPAKSTADSPSGTNSDEVFKKKP